MTTNNTDSAAGVLLPCPFCGGPVELEKTIDGREWYGVVCRNTRNLGGTCAIQTRPAASVEAAVGRWNRRASAPVIDKSMVKRLATQFGLIPEGERSAWQPIETAPKDGTKIVISVIDDGVVFDVCNGHFEVLVDDEDDGPWDIRDGEPVCSYIGREAGTYFCCWLPGKEWERGWKVTETFEYTHWMPLPAAPGALSQPKQEG